MLVSALSYLLNCVQGLTQNCSTYYKEVLHGKMGLLSEAGRGGSDLTFFSGGRIASATTRGHFTEIPAHLCWHLYFPPTVRFPKKDFPS